MSIRLTVHVSSSAHTHTHWLHVASWVSGSRDLGLLTIAPGGAQRTLGTPGGASQLRRWVELERGWSRFLEGRRSHKTLEDYAEDFTCFRPKRTHVMRLLSTFFNYIYPA